MTVLLPIKTLFDDRKVGASCLCMMVWGVEPRTITQMIAPLIRSATDRIGDERVNVTGVRGNRGAPNLKSPTKSASAAAVFCAPRRAALRFADMATLHVANRYLLRAAESIRQHLAREPLPRPSTAMSLRSGIGS